MDVPAAQCQRVRARAREGRTSAAILGDEDVTGSVVVKDPADVAAQKVVEIEVSLVGQAPDALARVEEVPRTELPRAPPSIDHLQRRA